MFVKIVVEFTIGSYSVDGNTTKRNVFDFKSDLIEVFPNSDPHLIRQPV